MIMTQWTGEEIIEIARPHLGEAYTLGARAQLTNPNYRGPWDCAEFASWCAYQAYEVVFGAYGSTPRTADPYSGKWYEDGRDADALISYQEALQIPGAIIGRRPRTMGQRIGHVAISLGGGQTIEARSRRHGVVIVDSASRPWNFGVLIPGVEYRSGGQGSIVSQATDRILRVESPFMRGPDVRCVQEALSARGVDPGVIDGIYGEGTETAVYNFQALEGLTVDGEVGAETARELGLGWPIDPSCSGVGTTGTAGAAGVPSTYSVVAGDSLHRISQRFGCTLDALMDANPQITNPNLIRVGQTLNIPAAATGTLFAGTGAISGFTDADLEVMAKTIYGEARGEPQIGQEAVGFVVLNRVNKRSWWGDDIIGVCKHPWQFSCWNRNDPNSSLLNSMTAGDQRLLPFLDVARRVLTNQARNPVSDATHYYADYISEPSWVPGSTFVTQIGRHRFYTNVA
jgi:spore germination cell wall hydrolase CwlJ-like protein